jgi:TolA-binding protein
MDDELENENMNFMDDDTGREIVSKSKKITLNMLWDELQKANKSIEELKLRIEEIKNDISHILGHLEQNQ